MFILDKMSKGCKIINILFEVVLILISLLCAALGAWLILQEDWSLEIFGLYSVKTLGYVVVSAGILIFVTSIIGFCGTTCKNKCCSLIFVTVIGIGFLVLLVAASLLFTYQKKVHDFLGNQVNKEFLNKYGYEATFTHIWDEIQSDRTCCGVVSGVDYKSTKWNNNPNEEFPREGNVPSSCCTKFSNGSHINFTKCMKDRPEDKSEFIYADGCLDKIKEKIIRITFITAVALFVFSGILLIIMTAGCVMLCNISRDIRYGQVV